MKFESFESNYWKFMFYNHDDWKQLSYIIYLASYVSFDNPLSWIFKISSQKECFESNLRITFVL